MTVLKFLDWPKSISRKIWEAKNSWISTLWEKKQNFILNRYRLFNDAIIVVVLNINFFQ